MIKAVNCISMLVLSVGMSVSFAWANASSEIYVYNWSDYIAPTTNPAFTKATGINVIYDVYDSNAVLESKLFSGKRGYDIVSPSHNFLGTQIRAGIYLPLDKSKIPNLKYLNPTNMQWLAKAVDPNNTYAIPYAWGTTGIGYNVDRVRKILGDKAPLQSWALVLDPGIMKALQEGGCSVGFLDAPDEVFFSVLKYLHPGKDYNPDDATMSDYKAATAQMLKVRPYISYFNAGRLVSDLANGDICVALAWSGDVYQASQRAKEAHNGVKLAYVVPKEGAMAWFDMLAIPKNAPHPKQAMAYLNFILQPKVSADIVNYIRYASANDAAKRDIHPDILSNTAIYPDAKAISRLFLPAPLSAKMSRFITRQWTRVESGR